MPKTIFKLLWDRIQAKDEIFACIINKTKDNNYYWVFANITASLDTGGNIIGYYSVRRKLNPKALEIIIPLYKQILTAEISGGISAGMKVLQNLLDEKGVSYDEFIISLQE